MRTRIEFHIRGYSILQIENQLSPDNKRNVSLILVMSPFTYGNFLLSIVRLDGPNAVYSLAVISFSIGLVTGEVINAPIRFTREKLGLGGKDSSNKKNQETKTKETPSG